MNTAKWAKYDDKGRLCWYEPPVPRAVLDHAKPHYDGDFVSRLYGFAGVLLQTQREVVPDTPADAGANRATTLLIRELLRCPASWAIRHGHNVQRPKRTVTKVRFVKHCQKVACPIESLARFERGRKRIEQMLIRSQPQLIHVTVAHETLVTKPLDAGRVYTSLRRLGIRFRSWRMLLLQHGVAGGFWNWELDRSRREKARVVQVHAHALVEVEDGADFAQLARVMRDGWMSLAIDGEEHKVESRPLGEGAREIQDTLRYVAGFRRREEGTSLKLLDGFRLPRFSPASRHAKADRQDWRRRGPMYPDQLYMILAGYAYGALGHRPFGSWRGLAK